MFHVITLLVKLYDMLHYGASFKMIFIKKAGKMKTKTSLYKN